MVESDTTCPPPVQERRTGAMQRARLIYQRVEKRRYFNVITTTLAVLVWLGLTPVWVAATATFPQYGSASPTCIGLAVSTGLGCHLWPTRTAPWRTVVWNFLLTTWVGATLLGFGADSYSLIVVTLLGFVFLALRANGNAASLADAFRTWRVLR